MQWLVHPPTSRARGFTLVEIMIVVAILGIILGIAGQTWVRQRALSQATSCSENLSKIEGAKEQWALEYSVAVTASPSWSDLVSADGTGYLKRQPGCPTNGTYTMGTMEEPVTCSVTEPLDHNNLEKR